MKKIFNYNDFIKESNGFWGTIGAGILPICTKTKRVLMPLRSEDVEEPGTWGTWGGKLDDMETNDPKEAAKIEFLEEADYSGDIELIDSYKFENVDKYGDVNFTYYNYIGLIKEEFEPILNWETAECEWMDFKEFMSIEPKHFGLLALIKNDLDTIKKYML